MSQRIDELRATLREVPGSRLFFQLGDLLRKSNEVDEAEETLIAGLKHHPRYVAAWVSLGRIQLDKAKFSEAERSFTRALELDPENSVAARLIGETAERIGEWVRAIKAYKLARALSPRDQDLEERIEAITLRLAGGPDDITHEKGRESFGDDSHPGFQSTRVTPPKPEVLPDVFPEPEEPFGSGPSTSKSRVVFSMSEDDPFAMTESGDTGAWVEADDVFVPPKISIDPAVGDVFGDDTEEDISILPPEERHQRPEVQPFEAESEFEPDIDRPFPAEPIDPPEVESSREPPMPTVTLARLALEQGDRVLAVETLQAIMERDPDRPEAAELLASLKEDVVPDVSAISPPAPQAGTVVLAAAKAEVLEGWMENIRAAAERRAP